MSKRIERLNELIKRELGKIILREVEFPKNVLVTITRVETSSDLSDSNVWVSVFPEDQTERVFKILNYKIYNLQQKINKLLKMRPIPKLNFMREKEIKKADKIEELLEKVKHV